MGKLRTLIKVHSNWQSFSKSCQITIARRTQPKLNLRDAPLAQADGTAVEGRLGRRFAFESHGLTFPAHWEGWRHLRLEFPAAAGF